MFENTLLPSLSRSKRFSINWSGTVTPVKNYQYFFSFDEEVKEGILTGIQPEISIVNPFGTEFSRFNGNDYNNVDAYITAYITLVNKEGEIVVDGLPVMSLFQGEVAAGIVPGLRIKTFCVNVDPSKSYITFNASPGDFPVNMPTGINFTWYYKKRIK
jgi:hypothetical protein